MKAYLITNKQEFSPFLKPASAMALKGETVGERLRRQLREAGCQIVEAQSFEALNPEPHSLAIQDDMLLSARFLTTFLRELPDRKRDYHFHMNMAKLPLLSTRDARPQFRAMPLHYFGENPGEVHAEVLEFQGSTVFDTAEGMPQRIGDFTDLHIYFLDAYAIQLEHWFDLLTGNALYCKEYLVERIRPLRRFLPPSLISRFLHSRVIRERSNAVGRNCRIHPTAILEGCVIGDNVEIGPFCYLRSSVVGDGAVIREKSTAKASYIGAGASIGCVDVTNCYIGAQSFVLSPILNVVLGERVFLAGGSGFADFIFGAQSITASINGADVPSGLNFLGSAVGDDSFIGAGIGFAPGRTIPSGSYIMTNALVKNVPTTPHGTYVLSGNTLLQIPSSFVGR